MSPPTPSLTGVRVLDLTRLLPGPYATWLLASMGAEVVKVEDPGMGDYARAFPPTIGPNAALFHVINRGKRSLVLDLKRPEGRDALLRLVPGFDVVFEQFRPGVLDRLGVGWSALKAAREDLILCSLSGYGQDGPMAGAAGHDLNYQALAGTLWMGGLAGGRPPNPAVPTADLSGALNAVIAILGALLHRDRGGGGAHLDISMTESIGALAAPLIAAWTAESPGAAPGRGEALLGGGIAQYATYATGDGRHVALGALEPKFFARFAQAVGRPEWVAAMPLPGPHQAGLRAELEALFLTKSRDEWVALLDGVDCCFSPVLDPAEAASGALFAARGVQGEAATSAATDAPVSRWTETPVGPPLESQPAGRGADSEQLLLEAGFSRDEVEGLKKSGALG